MESMSKIEWTDETWNPVTGCTKISAGCKNCYAERMHNRLVGMGSYKYDRARGFRDVRMYHSELERPLKWKKPRRIFVCSMSDLFHEDVPPYFIRNVLETCRMAKQHTFQILTKRPARAASLLLRWPKNVWFGVSVEQANEPMEHERITALAKVPANKRFVSFEPLLGPVRATFWWRAIDWVIVGGETGPGARHMDPGWARDISGSCKQFGIPFFMKQMANRAPIPRDLQIREFPS
jgi:protein gp37